jgi:hypothetical protein
MSLLTQHDFETAAGQKRIILKIHSLEQQVHELKRLVQVCLKKEGRLEEELEEYD